MERIEALFCLCCIAPEHCHAGDFHELDWKALSSAGWVVSGDSCFHWMKKEAPSRVIGLEDGALTVKKKKESQ